MKRGCQDRPLQPKWRLKSKMSRENQINDTPMGIVSAEAFREFDVVKGPTDERFGDLEREGTFAYAIVNEKTLQTATFETYDELRGAIGSAIGEGHEGLRVYVVPRRAA